MRSNPSDPMNPKVPNLSPDTRTRALRAPFIVILFLAAVIASGCIIHDNGRGGYGTYRGPVAVQPHVDVTVPAPVVFTFNDHHRHTVQDYYYRHPHQHHGNKYKYKGKWKYKRKSHLHRETQMYDVPVDLVRRLPRPPRGTRYIYDDDQMLLIDTNTRVVLDFINISVSNQPVAVPAPVSFSFTDHHRHTVQNYYHDHPEYYQGKKYKKKHKWKNKGNGRGRPQLPPGLAKRDVLPPGLQMQAIPVDLDRQLPAPPRGAQYGYHDNQVLLIDVDTRVVLDFINISVSMGY